MELMIKRALILACCTLSSPAIAESWTVLGSNRNCTVTYPAATITIKTRKASSGGGRILYRYSPCLARDKDSYEYMHCYGGSDGGGGDNMSGYAMTNYLKWYTTVNNRVFSVNLNIIPHKQALSNSRGASQLYLNRPVTWAGMTITQGPQYSGYQDITGGQGSNINQFEYSMTRYEHTFKFYCPDEPVEPVVASLYFVFKGYGSDGSGNSTFPAPIITRGSLTPLSMSVTAPTEQIVLELGTPKVVSVPFEVTMSAPVTLQLKEVSAPSGTLATIKRQNYYTYNIFEPHKLVPHGNLITEVFKYKGELDIVLTRDTPGLYEYNFILSAAYM